jgi:LysM repeat protein
VGTKILVPDRTPIEIKRPDLVAKIKVNKKKSAKKSTLTKNDDQKFHIVKKGDNLSSIAKKYEVSVSTLTRLNKLKSRSTLRLGMKLAIPENNRL